MNLKSFSTLHIALGASVAVHAGLLAVRIVDPEGFNRVFQDTPLEVVLVNARSNEKPEKAQAIAQASLAGGGEADKGRATSPLPPSALTAIGDSAEDQQRRVEAMQEQQMLMLAHLKQQLSSMPLSDPQQSPNSPEAKAREDRRKHQMQVIAEIERRINEENARPKKRYISPATREEVYAVYYDSLRRKIEERGTTNFPELGGKKLYGELILTVVVNFDGTVVETTVESGSGNTFLDRRAQAIVKSAGPFGRVPSAAQAVMLKSGFNRLAFVSTFKFTRDETLEARLKGQ